MKCEYCGLRFPKLKVSDDLSDKNARWVSVNLMQCTGECIKRVKAQEATRQ